MSIYSFKITKGQYQLNLSTTDKELIVSQFEKWVRQTSDYVQKQKVQQCKEMINDQINTEKELTQQKIDEQLRNDQTENVHEYVQNQSQEASQSENLVVDTNNNKQVAEQSTTQSDLDIFYAPPSAQRTIASIEEEQASSDNANKGFESVLENSMTNPQTEISFKPSPSIKKDNAFLNYINSRKIDKKIDYLLLTAYYFTQYEQKPRFTLNNLMQN